jgi:hypothetical protein
MRVYARVKGGGATGTTYRIYIMYLYIENKIMCRSSETLVGMIAENLQSHRH